jgi:uncharacterized iron-regulated protein
MLNLIAVILIILLTPLYSHAGSPDKGLIPEYKLEVSIDPLESRISGSSRISVRAGQAFSVYRGSLRINDLKLNSETVDFDGNASSILITPVEDGTLEIRFEGVFKGRDDPDPSVPGSIGNVIDKRGVSLTRLWYPGISGLSYHRLKATLPEGFEAISEADEIKKTVRDGFVDFHFEFPHPLEEISLVASDRYHLTRDRVDGIDIHAYFFEEDSDLAPAYIEYTKKYLQLYEELLGRYPFRRFSVVENFLPTGYSMPSFTLLGSSVVHLPFIVETSLGHEILHQWFGNLVYIDHESGNWAEGLTAYLSDHLYKEMEGRGWKHRKQVMIDFMSYLGDEDEFPLKDFRSRFDRASRSVGYGKAAMLFHMLKNTVGEGPFFRALKGFISDYSFQKASWDDLRSSFEKIHGGELGHFFSMWVDLPGVPELNLEDAESIYRRDGFELKFTISQKGDLFDIPVPMTIYSGDRGVKRFFRVTEETNDFTVFLSDEPVRIVLDEDYDIMRRLHESEVPPVIGGVLGRRSLILLLPEDDGEIYREMIDAFQAKGAEVIKPDDISVSGMKSSSLIIPGYDNPYVSRLFGRLDPPDAGFSVTVTKNPWNPAGVIALFHARSKEELTAGFRKIIHYGKYSQLFFDDGKNTRKHIEDSQRGISMELKEKTPVVEVSSVNTLDHLIAEVAQRDIIYIGEFHDVFSHHAVQLDIIRGVHGQSEKMAIGMEMFQRPFQKTLDDYIAGRIEEREFLRETEYFKRWRFDYNLYKPILDYARRHAIPVVALNMEREIIDQVSDDGIDSLSPDDLGRIPEGMDFSDMEYRERIMDVFRHHRDWKEKNFDYFYQSQILWDETMSLSIDGYLRENPGHKIVVIAGQGHLEFGSGIPKRTLRRNGFPYAIVLIDASLDEGVADYVLYPKPVEGVTSPKLMVLLNLDDDVLEIAGFPHGSVSEEAGLKEGDIIMALDDQPISSLEDVKIQLFYRKKGDPVTVTVLRKENGREREIEFSYEL